MAQKFIVTDTRMLMGNVDYHKDLLPKKGNLTGTPMIHSILMDRMHNHHQAETPEENIKGGGWWHIDHEDKALYLWGASSDFGPAFQDDIVEAIDKPDTWLSPSIEGYKVMYSGRIATTLPDKASFIEISVIKE